MDGSVVAVAVAALAAGVAAVVAAAATASTRAAAAREVPVSMAGSSGNVVGSAGCAADRAVGGRGGGGQCLRA